MDKEIKKKLLVDLTLGKEVAYQYSFTAPEAFKFAKICAIFELDPWSTMLDVVGILDHLQTDLGRVEALEIALDFIAYAALANDEPPPPPPPGTLYFYTDPNVVTSEPQINNIDPATKMSKRTIKKSDRTKSKKAKK